MESSQQPLKKIRLSGGARKMLKQKEKSIKGNRSILSFIQSPVSETVISNSKSVEFEDSSFYDTNLTYIYIKLYYK